MDTKKHYVYLVPSTLSRAIANPTLFGGTPSPGPGGTGEDSTKLLLAFSIGAAVRLGQQGCVASLDVWKRKYKYKHNFKYKYMLRREKDYMPGLPSVATVCREDRGQKAGTRCTPLLSTLSLFTPGEDFSFGLSICTHHGHMYTTWTHVHTMNTWPHHGHMYIVHTMNTFTHQEHMDTPWTHG